MGDKALSERDIHAIVKIFQKNSNLIMNLHVLCEEIKRRVERDRSDSYDYLSLVLNKWIGLNSERATLKNLEVILRQENFNSTADEILTPESQPIPNTQNTKSTTKNKGTIVNKSDNIEPVQVPKSSLKEMRPVPSSSKVGPKLNQITEESTEIKKTITTTEVSDQLEEVKLDPHRNIP